MLALVMVAALAAPAQSCADGTVPLNVSGRTVCTRLPKPPGDRVAAQMAVDRLAGRAFLTRPQRRALPYSPPDTRRDFLSARRGQLLQLASLSEAGATEVKHHEGMRAAKPNRGGGTSFARTTEKLDGVGRDLATHTIQYRSEAS